MNIAFCLDNQYVPHCATVIASIVKNNIDETIKFHVLCDGITEANKGNLSAWIGKIDKKSIVFHDIDKSRFEDFPVGKAYVNISTYFRLAMPELMPELDKVLYLDCDTIVNGSLKELWDTDINDYALAGVRDRVNNYIHVYNRLRYPMSDGYINAGVILINLKRWREDNIFDRAITLAKEMPDALKNHDQDIINAIYHGQILMLPFKYNLLEYYLYVEEWLDMDRSYYPEIIEACKAPTIVHFCMPQKPWHIECFNPFKNLYAEYRKQTPWSDFTPVHRIEKLSGKQKLKLFLERLGLYRVERRKTLRDDVNVIEEPGNILF